jgi:hypothetical protein
MEDVLDQYEQPYDSKHPLICMDEMPCQLIGDVLVPVIPKPGKPKRIDYEYVRNGTCCVFIAFDPHTGWRMVRVKEHRTKADYADFMNEVAQHYPDAEYIRVVQDNLNTHSASSFYEAFPPEVAFELAKKFEFHFTPKKGSWLNMAEIEFSALSRQCLNRRIGDIKTLAKEAGAWEQDRNRIKATVRWQFTKNKAREKFYRHYSKVRN